MPPILTTNAGIFPAPVVSGEATVLIDVVGPDPLLNINAGTGGTLTGAGNAPNVGSGPNGTANRCLLAFVMFGSNNGGTCSVNSITWDTGVTNQAFTLVPGSKTSNGATGGDTEIWYLMAPATGSKAFTIAYSGSFVAGVGFASFVNVDQTGGTTSFPVVNVSTASGNTINISTTPTTRKLVGAFSSSSNHTTAGHNNIGKLTTLSIFSVACEWNAGTGTNVSYAGGTTGDSAAVAIKGV